MKKYFTLIFSIIIMLCIGGVYAWSIFVPPLRKVYSLTTAQTQMVFGFTIAFFTVAMILAGKIEKKYGAKTTLFIGSAFFSLGYLTAYFSKGNFYYILIGIGILSGIGIGFNYLATLVTPVKWFPGKKGLITGLSVAGFGGGAVILSNVADILLKKNTDVLDIFAYIGVIYGIIMVISTFFVYTPETSRNDEEKTASDLNLKNVLKDKNVWGLFFAMFTGTFAGLMAIGNLKQIGLSGGIEASAATLGISLLAVGNMLGRVFWGYVSDKLKGKTAIISALVFLALFTFSLIYLKGNATLFLVVAFGIGAGFGANFVLFAREVSNIYGMYNVGIIYPYVFLSYGIAGLTGPYIGGLIYDITKSYNVSAIVAGVLCILGAVVCYLLVNKESK